MDKRLKFVARLLDRVPNVIAVGMNCVSPEIVGEAIVVYPNSGENWDGRTHD